MARLFCLLNATTIAVVCIWCSAGLTFQDSKLPGFVIKAFKSTDWLHCLEECSNNDDCVSYNYNRLGSNCELKNFSPNIRCHASEDLVAFHSWIHHTLDPSKTIAIFDCDRCELFADGASLGEKTTKGESVAKFFIPSNTQVIAIIVKRMNGRRAFIGSFSNSLVTDESWKCTNEEKSPGFNDTTWTFSGFDDTNWSYATVLSGSGRNSKLHSQNAKWIWTDGNEKEVYCRVQLSD